MLNGRAGEEKPPKPDGSASQDVIGRYHATGFTRWYLTLFAVAWVLEGTTRFVGTHQWGSLAFAAAWTALAVKMWVVPNTVISDQGVRLAGRPIIPWSRW